MKRHAVPVIVAMLLLLPVLYLGSYCALVVPHGWFLSPEGASEPTPEMFFPRYYRWGGRTAAKIFWPVEQLDRKLRPDEWDSPWNEKPKLAVPFDSSR